MKIKKINTGILITKTAKQPSAKIEFSLDELDSLSEFCERLQDEKDIREYLTTAVTIPDSAEVSAPIAAKYLHDAALFEQLVDETRRNQEENQSNFLTAVSDAVSSIEKSRDVKEWHGLTKETAERFAREFMAERNPGRWSGFGEVPESVSLDPLNFPINDIYPKGNKPALRMQLISVTYPSLHRVCECSIIEDGVDLWARHRCTLDSMTAGTVENLVETILYVARMYERGKRKEPNIMSYGFDMGFAQANSLQEAMAIALEYTQSQMTEKNIRKAIRDNRYYIPSVRTGHIADEESKNRRADVLADTADRYWLEALFTFRFLYWEEHKLLGIIMMPPESASEKWPLSVYFQNSCDQDYPFFEWKEGNIPFFANAAAKAENYTAEEIRAKFDYEIEDEDLEYYRRDTCYNDIFGALALESWLDNHCTDVPFVAFALQGIQNEAERYRYLQWLKAEIQ